MPRKPRFFLPGVPAHVVQRGNNRQPIFFADADYRAYRGWLAEAAGRCGCAVHAYVLMTNHVHLLVTPETHASISRMMQYVGRRYVPYVNRAYGREPRRFGRVGSRARRSTARHICWPAPATSS